MNHAVDFRRIAAVRERNTASTDLVGKLDVGRIHRGVIRNPHGGGTRPITLLMYVCDALLITVTTSPLAVVANTFDTGS